MSALSQIAKDPSCLLAVDALQGGRWLSPLRPPVLRNFADNPMTFTDSYTAQDGIGTDDFTLSVDFSLLSKNVHGTIIIGCMSCIYYESTKGHQPHVRILKSDGKKGALYPVGTMHITEDIASIKVIKTGQNVRMVVHARDGSVVRDQTKPLPDGATVTSSSGDTTYPGSISAASIRNDTIGETVWQAAYSDLYDTSKPWPSAPSGSGSGTWEERTRLLTFTNITSSGGVFRAADDAKIAGIATPLDFRGNTKSKTFIVRAFCPSHDPASEKVYIHPFFGQGAIERGSSFYTFRFSIWEDQRSGGPTRLMPTISIGNDSLGPIVTGAEIYLDQWHTYAMVIDYNGGNCYIRAFVDGVLLRETTVSGTPVWNTPAATTTQETTVGIRRDPNASIYAGSLTKVSAALIFDRALTEAEIAAVSHAVV